MLRLYVEEGTLVTEPVTAVELASRLGVSAKQLRTWLRQEAAAGNVIVQNHQHGDRWVLTRDEEDGLAGEYRQGHSGP